MERTLLSSRTLVAAMLALLLGAAAAPLAAQEEEGKPGPGPGPVDLGKVLRESEEFRAKCKQFSIGFEEGRVRAVGEIVYRGGGPCEYLVNVFPVKPHETIVLLDDGPWEGEGRRDRRDLRGLATTLNNALLAAGFRKGKPFDWDRETGEVFLPEGDTVHIYCEWTDEEGNRHRARMEDWLWNYKTLDVMQPGHFVYTGSLMIDEGPPHHRKWFGAEVDGLLVGILNTSTVLIDNTEDGGLDNGAYEALPQRIPEIGTRVEVLFTRQPLESVERFPPLELTEEILAERERRKAEKAAKDAPGEGDEEAE